MRKVTRTATVRSDGNRWSERRDSRKDRRFDRYAATKPLAVGLFVLGLLMAATGSTATADSPVERFLEGLRQRELFSLAEGYCLRRLTRADLKPEERLTLVLQLSRTYSDHARRTAGSEQEDLWRRARSVVTQEIDRTAEPSVRLPLEVQLLLVSAAQARHLRWQWELSAFDARLKNRALQLLQQVVPQLSEKERAVTELLRAAHARRPSDPKRMRPYELRSLLLHLRLGLLQALLDRAQLLPKRSADRTASLLEAERCAKRLDSGVLSSAAKQDRDLLLARVYRLQSRYREAEQVLQTLEARRPPRLVADRILAEKARLLIDQDRVPDAAELLATRHRTGEPMPGELQFLFVRCLVVLWQAAREKQQTALAEELRQHIALLMEQASADPYWGTRCRRLLEQADTTGRLGERLATMIQQAKGLFASGNIEAAVAAYRQAAETARDEGQTDVAGDLAYTAASIELKQGHYEQAAAALADFATRFPGHGKAAEAHLLRAFALGKLYQQAVSAGKSEEAAQRRQQYVDALREHRKKFHGQPTWTDATWMLAVLDESEGKYAEALSLYGQIPAGDRRAADAQVGLARCYEAILDDLRRRGQPEDQWRRSAIAHLGRVVDRFPQPPQPLSVQQAEVAIRLARLLAEGRPPDFGRADRLLERAITSLQGQVTRAQSSSQESAGEPRERQADTAGNSATGLLHRAIQLRIVSLAARHQWDQAQTLLESLPADRPLDLLPVLDGLSELAADSDPSVREGLGQLQLTATSRLMKSQQTLTTAQQERLLRCRAQGFAATGDLRSAIELYEQLLRRRPKDTPLLRTLATLCLQCATTECLEKAKTYWRLLENRALPGSPDWMQSRYHVAECCFKLRQFELCRKLLSVARLLYGLPKDKTLRRKFQQLETAAEAATHPPNR